MQSKFHHIPIKEQTDVHTLYKDAVMFERVREPTLSMQEGGGRVLHIFHIQFRSPGDPRLKFFMAQQFF